MSNNWKHLLPAYLSLVFVIAGGVFQYGTLTKQAELNASAISINADQSKTAMDKIELKAEQALDKANSAYILAQSTSDRVDKLETALATLNAIRVDVAEMKATQKGIQQNVTDIKTDFRDLKK